MSTIMLSPAALADLNLLSNYFSDHTGRPSLARQFRASVHETAHLIASDPSVGRVVGDCEGAELRQVPVRRFATHRIFYAVQGKSLVLVRVLHGAGAATRLLDGEVSE